MPSSRIREEWLCALNSVDGDFWKGTQVMRQLKGGQGDREVNPSTFSGA